MIKYAGAPQLGDYVVINDRPESVRMVTTIVMNVNTSVKYSLDDMIISFEQDDLTRVKPTWNIGELVRYKGRVHQILIIEVKNYKFVYSLDNIGQWIAEDELEYVNDVKKSVSHGSRIKVNKYCLHDNLRGREGKIDIIELLGADCLLDSYPGLCYLRWEAIDIVEEKVKPYNAELICIESNDCAWEVGDLAIVKDNEMYFVEKDTGKKLCVAINVNCLDAVNKFFPRVTFAEIKETIGDKAGWNGKFYVVDATAGTSLKVGNVYVVREGILNVGGYSFTQRFTSFKEIQEKFDYVDLIEVKE